MGRNIGTLGQRREPLDLEFSYFDDTVIRVHPQATDAVEIEFLEAARDIDMSALEGLDLSKIDAMDPEQQVKLIRTMSAATAAGYGSLLTSLHRLIHPDDFEKYWRLGMEHGQQIRDRMADVRAITTAVIEATTDFPSGQRSASPSGPATTPPSSAVASPSPPAPRPGTDLEIALALDRGRPDIQEFYVMEAEQRAAMAQEERDRVARDARKLAEAGLTTG